MKIMGKFDTIGQLEKKQLQNLKNAFIIVFPFICPFSIILLSLAIHFQSCWFLSIIYLLYFFITFGLAMFFGGKVTYYIIIIEKRTRQQMVRHTKRYI